MSKKLYEESNIQEIASTIREKKGTQDTYKVSQMAEAMSDLIGPPAYNNMILAQDTQPDSEYNKVWFDTDADDEYTFPEIDDNNVSSTDTWSSQKIKAEDDELKSAIDEYKAGYLSLTIIPNKYVERNGNITNYNGWSMTDYIPVGNYKKIDVYTPAATNYCCWYDSNKNFLSNPSLSIGTNSMDVPQDAEYLIVSNSSSAMSSVTVKVVEENYDKAFTYLQLTFGDNKIIQTYDGNELSFIPIGLEENAEPPVITEKNKVLYFNGGYYDFDGQGATKTYDIGRTIGSTDTLALDCYFGANPSATRYLCVYNDNSLVTFWGEADVAHNHSITLGAGYNYNKIRFSLTMAEIDDCYCIDREMGVVIFAGKNTPYYGKRHTVSQSANIDKILMETDTTTPSTYAAMIEGVKNTWITTSDGNRDLIPIIITTDQHGLTVSPLMDTIRDTIGWESVSKVINIGDTVGDRYQSVATLPRVNRSADLDKYLADTSGIPYDNRIEVFGNHDTWGMDNNGYIGLAPTSFLYKYFRNPNAEYFDNYGNFIIDDPRYRVRFICVSSQTYDKTNGSATTYAMTSESIEWIIDKMKETDYDIVLISHEPFGFYGIDKNTDVTYPTSSDDKWGLSGSNVLDGVYLDDLWKKRKAKTSGTVTDYFGVTHSFDFSNCKGDLLCGLHGHMHADGYYYIGDFLDIYFDSWKQGNNACFFILIDRVEQELNIWKVNIQSDVPTQQHYTVDL